jgi:RNA polymerase subunit RPABC4/transcription elongation factor Spt4
MTIKVCPRCHQAFETRHDFVVYCEECLSVNDWSDVVKYVQDDE